MAEPFLSEIRMFSFGFAPTGWATCDGQTLQISQNQALYALIGIIYGGNGSTTFNLPDLRGRTPIHFSASYGEGSKGGSEGVVLNSSTMPAHTHTLEAGTVTATASTVANNILATLAAGKADFAPAANLTAMNAGAISTAGSSTPHNNMQPSLVINFCIALQGIFPSRD